MLATLVCSENNWLAAIVLKNTLRNHVVELKSTNEMQQELDAVKKMLLERLLHSPLEKKIESEVIKMVTKVVIHEFFNDTNDCGFFNLIIE